MTLLLGRIDIKANINMLAQICVFIAGIVRSLDM